MGNQRIKSEIIGVVAVFFAVTPDDRVDCPDALRFVRQFVQIRNDRLFVGNGHVQRIVAVAGQKARQLIRCKLDQTVFVVGKLPVDLGRKAVPQVLPQKPAPQRLISGLFHMISE